MPNSATYRTFVKIVIGFSLGLFGMLAFFNLLIDPFGIYSVPYIEKINKVKIELSKQERLYKAVAIARLKPQALILGSSRTLIGLDPTDLKAIVDVEAYNGSFSGATFEEIYHYFDHALYHQPQLQTVVVGIDFFGFNEGNPAPNFSTARLKSALLTKEDIFNTLFTIQAFKNSFTTLRKNLTHPTDEIILLPHGEANVKNMANPDKNPILQKGDLAYLNKMLNTDYKNYRIDEKKVQLFKQMVQTCQERGINLQVFICPSKAIYWETIYRKHLTSFEELKQRLSAIYPIWDFSGFNCVTMQVIENSVQPLYFECSHFRPYVGKLILNKMFNQSNFPLGFGYLLTAQTIDQALKSMRTEAQLWLESHENILEKIQAIPEHPNF